MTLVEQIAVIMQHHIKSKLLRYQGFEYFSLAQKLIDDLNLVQLDEDQSLPDLRVEENSEFINNVEFVNVGWTLANSHNKIWSRTISRRLSSRRGNE